MRDFLIVVAGGKGLRMGGDVPQQFVPVAGLPVLMRTPLRLHESAPEAQIILALPRDHQDYWRELCGQYAFTLPHIVADGGATRFHSVQNALAHVPADADGVVGVHDGVRPFVCADVVRRCMDEARISGAAIPVVPVVETLRRLDNGGADSHTEPRGEFRLVQTPQCFRADLLKKAYAQPYTDAFTDDASVVEAMGHTIALVDGNRDNIKLTTPEDLKYAEFLCRAST